MCFEADAVPPITPVKGAAIEHQDLTLQASDGNEFAAFEARAEHPSGAAVVVLPDVRGLFRFYEELALRFAEQGHDAIVIDYFGRTEGVGKRANDWDYWPHVEKTTHDGIRADVAAAIDHAATFGDREVFTIGFCFGGSNSFHQAANGFGLAGAIGFYGHPNRPGFPIGAEALVDRATDMDCPILGMWGGDDPGIPAQEVEAFREALAGAGVEHEVVVYPGAPHSFFDRKYDEFAEESADAWARSLAFIEAHLS